MPPRFQIRNSARRDLLGADLADFRYNAETNGRQGIYNGAFSQPRRVYTHPAAVTSQVAGWPWPDGWEFWPNDPHTITLTNADSAAGDHCVEGTRVGGGAVLTGYMIQSRFIPATNLSLYIVRTSMRASGAAITCRWGFACYGAGKAFIANVFGYAGAPGAAWAQATVNYGSAGTALSFGTRWIRYLLEFNDTTAGSWVRVDNIIFEM